MLKEAPNPTTYVIKALKKILKPLVNLLIAKGITYPIFNELVKELYVQVAETEFKLQNKQQTDSRINFLTGIHRKDVKRIRSSVMEADVAEVASLSALLISRWLGDPVFCDEQGQPMALPRLIKRGGDVSFEGLVVSINKDIRSRAILDEWLNLKMVYLDENDRVCLNKNAFVPPQEAKEKAWFFGENGRDHMAAAVSNLKQDSQPFLERAVYYDQLCIDSIQELAELSEKLGMKMLLKMNAHALTLQTKDKQKKCEKHRMRLGLYFYNCTDDGRAVD